MMFTIAYLGDFYTYTDSSKLIGVPMLGLILGFILGFLWEIYQLQQKQTIEVGWFDVFRTAIGGLIGALAGTFFLY